MRVLSLTRPWDELILAGVKPVENRVWRTDYTGPLIIHAAKSWDRDALTLARGLRAAGQAPGVTDELLARLADRAAAPTGYRGVVLLTHVCAGRDPDDPCGPWAFPDQFHWRVRAPHRLDPAIPGPGALGLRPPSAAVRAAAEALIAGDPAYQSGMLL